MTQKTAAASLSLSVGEELRLAREARALTIEQVAKLTKVRAHYLKQMEAGQFADLPPGTYALSYIRSYAKFLGLNPAQVITRVTEEELPKNKLRAERHVAGMLEETLSVVPTPSLTIFTALCALVFVVGYGLYFGNRDIPATSQYLYKPRPVVILRAIQPDTITLGEKQMSVKEGQLIFLPFADTSVLKLDAYTTVRTIFTK